MLIFRKFQESVTTVVHNFLKFRKENKDKPLRAQVFALFNTTPHSHNVNKYIDSIVILAVLVSVVCIVLETVQEVNQVWSPEFHILDLITVCIFSIEYVLRVYSCCELEEFQKPFKGRLKYMTTASALVDLIAVCPFYIDIFLTKSLDLRFLRIFRLTRLLKLTRYTGTLNTLVKAVQREKYVLLAAAFMMFLMIILTASLGYLFEHDAQPDKFESIPTSMYWAVVTLASVGYGDITPITPLGRFMTVIVSFVGIGIFAIPAGLMASSFTDQLRLDRNLFEDQVRKLVTSDSFTDEERENLALEADRLHLSQAVFEEIIARVEMENKSSNTAASVDAGTGQPTTSSPGRVSPELTLEEYRTQISALRSLALGENAEVLTALITNESKTTQLEREIWKSLSA